MGFKFQDNQDWVGTKRQSVSIEYSVPVVGYIDSVLINAGDEIELDAFTKIGFVRGFEPWILKPRIDAGVLKATELNSLKSPPKLLQRNRFQGAYFNVAVAQHLSADDVKFADNLPHERTNYRLSTTKHSEVVQALDAFFVSAEVDQIRKHNGLELH